MNRCAIFVDAGYLFAQGSACLAGSKKTRTELVLDAPAVIDELKFIAKAKAPDSTLLRVYWYDGAVGGFRPTTDQALVANLDDVKLRLGFVNSHGQQKGVDSLIVTDLIELARLKSIGDAVLLSGDEDVRVGVQIAQNYGVRVHLLGIEPARASQSNQLLQEADTTTEWPRECVSRFLSIRTASAGEAAAALETSKDTRSAALVDDTVATHEIQLAVNVFVENLTDTDIQGINAYWKTARGVPPDLDKRLLPACGRAIGRNLGREEIRLMRTLFQQAVIKRA